MSLTEKKEGRTFQLSKRVFFPKEINIHLKHGVNPIKEKYCLNENK
jgi:hypothetical protein